MFNHLLPKTFQYSQGKPQKLDLPSLPLQPFKTYTRRRGNSGNDVLL